jgi:3-methyladenine DNA glycosylase AlkC
VKKSAQYRETLRTLEDWDSFLLEESGLPGPRGNLELAQAVADEGDETLFRRYLSFDAEKAPVNSPYEFLAFCGAVGLGRLLAEGKTEVLETLRLCASDPRWRMREGVAMALQRFGEKDMDALLREMEQWSQGNLLEKRAAAAALCEPKLLREREQVKRVLQILDEITASLHGVENRRSDEFQALRKGLGYCWSVAVAALPEEGKAMMEKWLADDDKDVRWIMKENLKKNRLARVDGRWVESWKARLGVK